MDGMNVIIIFLSQNQRMQECRTDGLIIKN
jgi:hypothetical protein